MSLLQQLLELLGLRKSRAKRRRPATSGAALRQSGLVRCQQCRATIRIGIKRCQQCGARVIKPAARAGGTGTLVPGLTDLQRKILTNTMDSETQTIHVVPPTGEDAGEVKAGTQRMGGDDVLFAVERLWQKGYIEPTENECFRPTEKGRDAISEPAD